MLRNIDIEFSGTRLRFTCVQGIHPVVICSNPAANQTPNVQPTPLYFMDEIDAALDFRNVSIVANYIKDRTKNAQFIIISLRYVLLFQIFCLYLTVNYIGTGMTCSNSATGS